MIISRTPFRISFLGGGTDYPAWYLKHGGEVLSTTIDKYCYLTCRYLPPFFEHKFRVVYSAIESCATINDIKHPSVRACLKFLDINRGVEIHHDGDLPARSGMGSSSSFTVGLLHALYALQGRMPSKNDLALQAIHVEQEILKECVGSQDQVGAAYGGLNHVTFDTSGSINCRSVIASPARINELNDHLMLFYTNIKRTAANVAKSYTEDMEAKRRQLRIMKDLVREGLSILVGNGEICHFGELLHEGWKAKRSLSDKVSNEQVDQVYERARKAGAVGGKITGAGGGGFLMLFVPPDRQKMVRAALGNLIHVPFRFDRNGSQIIFYDMEQDYSMAEKARDSMGQVVFSELNPEEAAIWPA